ncbi:MAG: sugar ABC transporter substrate-binding protein [Anaerolinea sp.]|jgi:ribose transport system substrate-binding protein|nr:sugar ABC transporter substrate-binding protein [Anaerolinea sp.]
MKRVQAARRATLIAGLLLVTACSGQAPAGSTPGDGVAGQKIVLMVGVKGDPFYVSMECGAREKATQLSIDLQVQGPDKFDATLQNPLLDAVAASKPAALLVAPNDVIASANPLKKIQDAGAKVILVDTTVDDPSIGVSRIATDNKLGGAKAAEALNELTGGATGKVLVISTDPGVSSVDARVAGFEEAVKTRFTNFTLAGPTQYSHNSPQEAATIIQAELQRSPDLIGVFATNLFSAQGTAAGVRSAGKGGVVKVVGFDAGPDQIKQLKAGDVQALVAQKPYDIGFQGIEQAAAALSGKTVTQSIATESLIVTADNIDDPAVAKYVYKSGC